MSKQRMRKRKRREKEKANHTKRYAYVRVSTIDQNEARQIDAMHRRGIADSYIYVEKRSGKDFERPEYRKLLKRMREGDVLYIQSIDRLGRNYNQIREEWSRLTKIKKINIVVLDMPLLDTRQYKDLVGTLISDLVLELLAYVAESERNSIRVRTVQGLEAARARGVKLGRPLKTFVRFCDCFDIPILTLVDVPGYMPGIEEERKGILRHGSKILYAFAEATVPKVSIILRKAYGGSYCAMNSKDLGADIVFAWPICEFAVMGASGAVDVIYHKQLEEAQEPEKLRNELVRQYKEKYLDPYFAAKYGMIDEVILPEDTRRKIIYAFESLKDKRQERMDKKHGNISL